MNTRINNLPTGTLSDSDYIVFDGSGGTKKALGSLITNKANKTYVDSHDGYLGNAIGMRGWNQLIALSHLPSTQTINGITITNNGDGSLTTSGTSTAQIQILVSFGGNTASGHILKNGKYLIIGGPTGSNVQKYFRLRTYTSGGYEKSAYLTYNGGGTVFEITDNDYGCNCDIVFETSGLSGDGLVWKPQIFYLTGLFGAGNEPSTVAEFRAMFPADYYPYHNNTNSLADLNYTVVSTWT